MAELMRAIPTQDTDLIKLNKENEAEFSKKMQEKIMSFASANDTIMNATNIDVSLAKAGRKAEEKYPARGGFGQTRARSKYRGWDAQQAVR